MKKEISRYKHQFVAEGRRGRIHGANTSHKIDSGDRGRRPRRGRQRLELIWANYSIHLRLDAEDGGFAKRNYE